MLDNSVRQPLSSSMAAISPVVRYGQHETSKVQARKEGMFRKAAFFFIWMMVFVIPWENGVVIHGFGTITRVVGIPAFGMALLAILESGKLRSLAVQHIVMLMFFIWAGLTYFWSYDPSATKTSIYTFIQMFVMVWLLWEFAQTRREQILLLRAYMAGSLVSSVADSNITA